MGGVATAQVEFFLVLPVLSCYNNGMIGGVPLLAAAYFGTPGSKEMDTDGGFKGTAEGDSKIRSKKL